MCVFCPCEITVIFAENNFAKKRAKTKYLRPVLTFCFNSLKISYEIDFNMHFTPENSRVSNTRYIHFY